MGLDKTETLQERDGLPEALRVLLQAYPRADWEVHANFGELVRFWLDRHLMFRKLTETLHEDLHGLLDNQMAFEAYAPRLSRFGGMLLNQLHGHHQIEDMHYFPQLIGLDARVSRGFDLLEADHAEMDGLLHGFAEGANAVLQGGEPGRFLDQLEQFGGLLDRHLVDEEEIIVPVILHTGFRG